MTDNPFKKATKENARLRMAITGPSGSGKTYTALTLATAIGKTAVLDTERGSAKKYADLFDFDVLEIETFSPSLYIRAIERAVEFGYEVIVLDSLSHAWAGIGGVLDIVEDQKKKEQNKFTAWAKGTEEQNKLIDAILGSDIHVIGTMRSKTEYVIGDDKKPVKVGMAPIQRDGFEYEFDIIGAMDMDNDMVIEKTRCPALNGKVINKPNGELSQTLRAWLSDGAKPAPKAVAVEQPEPTPEPTEPPVSIPEQREQPQPVATHQSKPKPTQKRAEKLTTPQNGNGAEFPTIRQYWPDLDNATLQRTVPDLLALGMNVGLVVYGSNEETIKRLGYENKAEVKRKLELNSSKEFQGTLGDLLNRVLALSAVGVPSEL